MSLAYDPEKMSTGFADIDQQHRELIARLNRLLSGMSAGHGQEELLPLVDFLIEYTVKHFGHEERCMALHHCPVAAANNAAHDQFLLAVRDFRNRLKAEGPSVTLLVDAQRDLSDWVRNHIIHVDTHLRDCALVHSAAD